MNTTGEVWSSELREQTRKAVDDFDFASLGDLVAFKHVDGRFGAITISDLISGRLELTVRRSGDIEMFADAQQLIDAGWAID